MLIDVQKSVPILCQLKSVYTIKKLKPRQPSWTFTCCASRRMSSCVYTEEDKIRSPRRQPKNPKIIKTSTLDLRISKTPPQRRRSPKERYPRISHVNLRISGIHSRVYTTSLFNDVAPTMPFGYFCFSVRYLTADSNREASNYPPSPHTIHLPRSPRMNECMKIRQNPTDKDTKTTHHTSSVPLTSTRPLFSLDPTSPSPVPSSCTLPRLHLSKFKRSIIQHLTKRIP